MHLARSANGVLYIDELEPVSDSSLTRPPDAYPYPQSIRNLCSGFSYCLSLLETFYVWYGLGSTEDERRAALQYARNITEDPTNVVELIEGEEDELFWLILGEGEYAKADYWKWKPALESLDVRAWLVDADNKQNAVSLFLFHRVHDCLLTSHLILQHVSHAFVESAADIHDRVHVLDCIWEFFVLVGSGARGRRKDIRLALSVAKVGTYVPRIASLLTFAL